MKQTLKIEYILLPFFKLKLQSMKKLVNVVIIPALLIVCLISPNAAKANWISNNNPPTQHTLHKDTQSTQKDSLPEGVTQDWLNSLLDENGNSIVPENISEDPEIDAFQSTEFNGQANNNYFGYSVSSAGDVNADGFDDILVGAYGYSSNKGRAYIYYGGTIINNVADVVMTGQNAGDNFGYSVSTAGDINKDGYDDVIVGASKYNTDEGRVYVYLGGASMNSVPDFIFTGSAGDDFGISVSSAGDVNNDGYDDVIVGASGYLGETGYSIIYLGGPVNLIGGPVITGFAIGNNFGYSVSDAGDVNNDGFDDVIIGAYAYNSTVGRAYLYFGGSPMNDVVDVTYTGPSSSLWFGVSVSGAGDVNGDGFDDVIVGAMRYSSFKGRAYIYFGGASPNNVIDVTMTGEASSNYFGNSVSTAGDINDDGYDDVIIGAYGNSSFTGRAYIFFGGAIMNDTVDVTISGESSGNYFGYSVANAGDVNGNGFPDLLAGAYTYSSNTGRAYFYDYFMENEIVSDLTMAGETSGDKFGFSVSSAGDVNGDGYDDVIVGANQNSAFTGKAYIYLGGIIMDNIADVTMTGEAANNRFGWSVSDAGDVNNDGYDDVIVGAFGYSSNTGRAYLFFGGASMNNTADVIMTGESTNNRFGYSVSTADNVNNDGYDDVIVGAYGYSSNTGRAYVFLGGASMNNTPDVTMTGEATGNNFGISVSNAGSVNSNIYSDVIVGAMGFNSSTGKAYIYLGGSPMNNTPDVIMTGEAIFNYFGRSVSSAGDINGDGFDDVIVGANGYSLFNGRAYIFLGGSVMNNTADLTMTGDTINMHFGWSVSDAGDVNNDGYSDVIVGAPDYLSNTGKAYIYYGGYELNNTADATITGETADDRYGVSVSSAGDLNGDGFSDMIVGASDHSSEAGKTYIHLGSAKAPIMVELLFYIEGFYNPGINIQVSDTASVVLRNSTSPFAIVDEAKGKVKTSGFIELNFLNAPGGNYYIAIKHRNSIETWKATSISVTSGNPSFYNLSSSPVHTYGNNLTQIDASPVRFGIYSGDENQDGFVNLTDIVNVNNNATAFVNGYVSSDMNGDNLTDLADVVITYNNSVGFVAKITP